MAHIAIVGGGQAGFSAADRIRKNGFEGDVTLYCAEPVPPYQRPPLSKKYLTGEMDLDRLFFRPETYFAEQGITLALGAAVTAIDPAARTLTVDGKSVTYDQLALTTGAIPRMLPPAIGGDLEGIYGVRSLADVDTMAAEFETGRRVLVVGGGYIGLEAASVAAMRGLDVTLVEAADRILGRVASEETANFLRALHLSKGVKIIEGTGLERFIGDARVTGARLSDGQEIPADFAIVGIGIAPDTALAESAGLDIENGIRVDALCRTSDPAIFAAGDCASFPHGDGRLRLESVGNAIDMAEAMADAMTGGAAPYIPKPWFWSDQYDVTLQIAGLNTGYDRVVTRPGEREGGQSWWYFKGPELLAVDAVGDARAYMMGKRWIEAGKSPAPDRIGDPAEALKTLAVT